MGAKTVMTLSHGAMPWGHNQGWMDGTRKDKKEGKGRMRHRWWMDGDGEIRGGGLDREGSLRRHAGIGGGETVRVLAFVGRGRTLQATEEALAELTVLLAGVCVAVKGPPNIVWRGAIEKGRKLTLRTCRRDMGVDPLRAARMTEWQPGLEEGRLEVTGLTGKR